MTASLSFQIDTRQDVIKIPNAALWFYPSREQVHPEDRDLLEGADDTPMERSPSETALPAAVKAVANRERVRRHVWVVDGEFLRAVEVLVGLMDHQHTELVEGDVQVGQQLVTGIDPRR
jgi:HlyD family secretion protein